MAYRFFIAVLGLLSVSLAGCVSTSTEPNIVVDKNPQVVMPAEATYAWQVDGGEPLAGEVSSLSRETAHLIEAAIDRGLDARGYRQTTVPQAAFWVHYHVGVLSGRRLEEQTVPTYGQTVVCSLPDCRHSFVWGRYGAPEVTERLISYREGTLMIDIVERQSGRIAYRATARRELSAHERASSRELDKIVAEMLAELPSR